MKRANKRGITLIELLVVVTIIGLFAALVAPRLWNKVGGAKNTVTRQQINDFMTALGAYKLDTGLYPSTEMGLTSLRNKPQNVPQWQGPYLPQDIPVDPWGRAYIYKYPGEHNADEPEITCLGADGQPGGEGIMADIVSWKAQ